MYFTYYRCISGTFSSLYVTLKCFAPRSCTIFCNSLIRAIFHITKNSRLTQYIHLYHLGLHHKKSESLPTFPLFTQFKSFLTFLRPGIFAAICFDTPFGTLICTPNNIRINQIINKNIKIGIRQDVTNITAINSIN